MKRLLSLYSLIVLLMTAGASGVYAQSVSVDKSSLNFTVLLNGSPVSQTLTVSSATSESVPFFAISNGAYVKVNGQLSFGANTPSTITVTVDPTGLTAGAQQPTSLSIFSGTNNLSVPIHVTVSTIGANPGEVNFGGYTAGSTSVPAPQSVTLSGASTPFKAVASTTNGGSWLQVTPEEGTSPGAVTVLLNTALVPGLAVGTYRGKVTITPTGTTGAVAIEIAVTLTVSAAPVVTVSPSPMQFNIQSGGSNNITSQPFTIKVSPASQLSYGFTATVDPNPAGKNWITISSPSGYTDPQTGLAQVNIGVDASGLPANTYNGKFTVYTPGGSPTQTEVPVKLVVSATPLLNIPTNTLTFAYQLAGSAPAAQNVTVTATSGTLNYTLTASTESGGNWLTVPATGSTAAPFAVSVNPAGLTPGTYKGTVTVTGATTGSGTQTIPVTFKVSNDPMIVTNFTSMSFPYQLGQSLPASQSLRLTSSTGAPMTFTATLTETTCTGVNWLALNGASSPVTGSTDASLGVSVTPTGLGAGTCTGTISIAANVTSTGAPAVNSPLIVPVTLYVSTSALLTVSPAAPPTFTAAVGTQSLPPVTVTLNSTSPSDQLTYTTTFQTNNGGNWLLAGPLSGTTAAPNNIVTISVVPTLLSAGTYTGSVVVTASGPGSAAVANSPVTIPVTLTVTSGSLTLSANSANFTYTLGGSAPASQTITVGSSGTPLNYTAVGSSAFFTVTPPSGNTSTSGTLTIALDPTKLTQPGTYSGTVTVTAPGAGNSPATIAVTATVGAGTLSAPTTTLTFNQVAGGAAPASQTIAVTGTPGPLNFTATASTNTSWLTVTPASGTTPGSVQVSVNGASLTPGQYTGNVTIASTVAGSSPITIPVVLNVGAPQTLSVAPASLNFTYIVGQTVPAPKTIAVTSSGTSAPISAQAQVPNNGSWLAVTPATSAAPSTLTVTVIPGSLGAGTYTGTIQITSAASLTPVNVSVTLTVVQVPKPVVNAVGNAASYSTGSISPGENIVIFGTGVGPAEIASGYYNDRWNTVAGDTRVLFDGVAAPVIYSSTGQTSVMVPYGVSGRTSTSIVVEYLGVQSNPLTYNVASAAPGIYTQNSQGTGPGAILNQDGITVNGPNTPAARGSIVSVYMTGEGQTNPAGVDGAIITALKNPLAKVSATVGNQPADIDYAGSAGGLISGVMQVNLRIPANAPTGGAVPIVITVGTAQSQAGVTVAVQ